MTIKKDLKYYLGLPWTYTIQTEKHRNNLYYIIRVNELPGICTDAENVSEGMENIKEAIEAAITLYLKNQEEIPEPISRDKFKGNISYRTTAERHYTLVKVAQERHISMNKALDLIVDAGMQKFNRSQPSL